MQQMTWFRYGKNIFNIQALVIYLSMIAVCSLAMGFFVDWIYAFMHLSPTVLVGQASEIFPPALQVAGAVVLTIQSCWGSTG